MRYPPDYSSNVSPEAQRKFVREIIRPLIIGLVATALLTLGVVALFS